MSISRLSHTNSDFERRVDALLALLRGGRLTALGEAQDVDVQATVTEILHDLRSRGVEAILEWEEKLDGSNHGEDALRVSQAEIEAAHGAADPEFLALVRRVADNVREYQEAILIADPPPLKRAGRTLGVRYTPVDRVGIYVPGGKALYPSSVIVTVVPAQVAGVGEIHLASPPTGGDVAPMVLALAGELGIENVWRMGGAVAVGALAYGIDPVPMVDKMFGPGNAFVAEAKRQVLGQVGIDSMAGPSEVLIIADDTTPPEWAAADLLAQAEHNPGSAILITTAADWADEVEAALTDQVKGLERAEAARMALEKYSAVIVVEDLNQACDLANRFATEHLQLMTSCDLELLPKIRNAGAIFVGSHTPVPLGDYYAGPSHVLPTGGTARFFGPLSCNDFLKASSVLQYDEESLRADSEDVVDFASREGLTAHANAIRKRCDQG